MKNLAEQYEIIDFHAHPFDDETTNICSHTAFCGMSQENTVSYLKSLGIDRICGSVICQNRTGLKLYETPWEMIAESNRRVLKLKEAYGDFYVPGFHVHADYVRESCDEIEKMNRLGVKLIGELVPYAHGWKDYSCKGFDEILDVAAQYGMIVSFHTIEHDQIAEMVRKHPNVVFVAAHPGEFPGYMEHLEHMKKYENYYLDLSGTGFFRHGMLRRGIDTCGVERFLFGTDYPTCNPSMFLGGVLLDPLYSEEEKRMVLAGNAKRLLKEAGIA